MSIVLIGLKYCTSCQVGPIISMEDSVNMTWSRAGPTKALVYIPHPPLRGLPTWRRGLLNWQVVVLKIEDSNQKLVSWKHRKGTWVVLGFVKDVYAGPMPSDAGLCKPFEQDVACHCKCVFVFYKRAA